MVLLRRWRGRDLPLGSVGGPYLFAGDRGWGDTEGPQVVNTNDHVQSRLFVAEHPLAPVETGRRSIGFHHWFGNPTPCSVGWSMPGGPRDQFSFRIGIVNGSFYVTGGDRTFIRASRDSNTTASWWVRQTQDTLQIINGWAGLQASYTGRRPYVAANGLNNTFATAPGGGGFQMGGNGYAGAPTMWTGWIEGRQKPDGTLDLRWIDLDGDIIGTVTVTIPPGERLVDTLNFGTVDSTTAHVGAEGLRHFDFELWDDAPSDLNWPRGPYEPAASKMQRVVQTGPSSEQVVLQDLAVVGVVDGPPGSVLGDPGTSVRSINRWTFRGEKVLPPMRRDYSVFWKGSHGEPGSMICNIFRPLEADYEPPYRTVLWWHSGFFTGGSPWALPEAWAAKLCARGYAVVSFQYPLCDNPSILPNDYLGKVKHPVQIQWAKRAAWWVQQDEPAEVWGFDPDRVVACGYSAGADLALKVNVTREVTSDLGGHDTTMRAGFPELAGEPDPVVAGSFSYAGPVNWQRLIAEDKTGFIIQFTARAYMGLALGDPYTPILNTSAHLYVDSGDAPIGYVLGNQDPLIGPGNLDDLEQAANTAGVPFTGAVITADHDNIDTINDPDDPATGIVPWMNNLFGGAPS